MEFVFDFLELEIARRASCDMIAIFLHALLFGKHKQLLATTSNWGILASTVRGKLPMRVPNSRGCKFWISEAK
jgi:hypothetical protein